LRTAKLAKLTSVKCASSVCRRAPTCVSLHPLVAIFLRGGVLRYVCACVSHSYVPHDVPFVWLTVVLSQLLTPSFMNNLIKGKHQAAAFTFLVMGTPFVLKLLRLRAHVNSKTLQASQQPSPRRYFPSNENPSAGMASFLRIAWTCLCCVTLQRTQMLQDRHTLTRTFMVMSCRLRLLR
jgi:hypothetical protein